MAAKPKNAKKDQGNSILDQIESTIVERPFAIANRAFLAGIGLATEVQSGLATKFDELAIEGEKARDKAQLSAESVRDQAVKRLSAAKGRVAKRMESALATVLSYSPIATNDDIEKLGRRIEKALLQVAS